MTTVPEAVDMFMYDVLAGVCRLVLSPDVDPIEYPIKRHVWYDQTYTGKAEDGRVIRWMGWYANFRVIRSGCLYIDYVPNLLAHHEQIELYGELYASAVKNYCSYICMFTTGCKPSSREAFERLGFIVRQYSQAIHPCIVGNSESITHRILDCWIRFGELLLHSQKQLCTSRKS